MIKVKELKKNVPDLIGKVYTQSKGTVYVVEIPHGRIKIMPEHRKPGK